MKLGIIVNTNDTETAWNALLLGNEALSAGGNPTTIFLLGSGIQMGAIKDKTFNVAEGIDKFRVCTGLPVTGH